MIHYLYRIYHTARKFGGNTYKTNINCVHVLQKKVLRIVCNVDYQYHSNVLFKELRMLKLFDIIELKTAMIMYKANKKM